MTQPASNPSSDDLIRLVDGWKSRRILVVGDFMLDRHTFGHAQRLSPDAPVPVLARQHDTHQPGGAANVCLDLIALRQRVTCLGVVGLDSHGTILKDKLRQAGCQVTGLISDRTRPTTVKHNFIGLAQHRHPQKMLRVDDESIEPLSSKLVEKLLARADKAMPRVRAMILQDHCKGVLTQAVCQKLIKLARQHHVPVLVDPASIKDYSQYRGATCITPNRYEANLATGQKFASDLPKLARSLLRQLQLQTIILTLDKQGSLLLEKGKQPLLLPTQAREVYDVTGAGDMVMATLAGARVNGSSWPLAMQLANVGGGLAVQHFGMVPIELDHILLELLTQRHEELGKLRAIDQLLPELDAYRKQGKKIVLTNGCFDILHAGHVSYLRQASKAGDLLVVAVNSDQSIGRIKGLGRPVNKQADRLMVLSELQCIDYLILFHDDTPMKLIQAIKPDVLVKGGDYTLSQVVGGAWVKKHGGQVQLVNLVKGKSTTNIIQKIEAGKR